MEQLITGIKVIDLLCPLSVGGKNGLVGFPGKTTLLHHLIDTLHYDFGMYCAVGSRTGEMCEFVEARDLDKLHLAVINCGMGEPVGARAKALHSAATICQLLEPRPSSTQVLFVDDLSRVEQALEEIQAPKTALSNFQEAYLSNGRFTSVQCASSLEKHNLPALDCTITLSLDQAKRGLFPAVDPFLSQSSLLDATFLGDRHVEIANAVVACLHRERELADFTKTTGMVDDFTDEAKLAITRGRRLWKYLAQPLEIRCELEATIQDCEDILAGKYDDVAEQTLYMIGNLPARD
jgi:F-type H+-transporting ATPase subunit beta